MNQVEAANNLINYIRSWIVLSRGNPADQYETRLAVANARDDVVGALAVLDSTLPEGEDNVPNLRELAEDRLKTIKGMREEFVRLTAIEEIAGRLIDTARAGGGLSPELADLVTELTIALNTQEPR